MIWNKLTRKHRSKKEFSYLKWQRIKFSSGKVINKIKTIFNKFYQKTEKRLTHGKLIFGNLGYIQ